MLKSTYKGADAPSPLPQGWTEHKAPTGHSYFYNSITKESTYSRPNIQVQNELVPQSIPLPFSPANAFQLGGRDRQDAQIREVFSSRNTHDTRRSQPKDRPKSKYPIPGCEPWVLVKTRLGRRFVYNADKGESSWRFPPEVLKGVIEFDRLEREKKSRAEDAGAGETLQNVEKLKADENEDHSRTEKQPMVDSEGSEYEEVEVTDDEGDEENENPFKRLKAGGGAQDNPVDFDEDDIAFQLAAMGEDYGLDPGEYGVEDQNMEEGDEGLPLTEDDANALFKDMLNDYQINPYTTWEKLIELGHIVEDDRYTVLSNMRSRKEIWSEWSRTQIQAMKEERARQEQRDPRISYFAFLESKATPKLFWPEFRRKYQKEPEMRNTKLSDKDREKWYREYVKRFKLPESTQKADLVALLKSTPLDSLNRSSTIENLPTSMLTDLRFSTLRASIRESLLEAHIRSLPEAPIYSETSVEQDSVRVKENAERQRRERALAERQRRVDEEKRRQKGALQYSKSVLQDEEAEVNRAMKVSRDGLKGYMQLGE